MDKVALIGMEFYAYHGVYDEERIIGGTFMVDVEVGANVSASFQSDNVNKTINYEDIYRICKAVMSRPLNLIEAIAFKIEEQIRNEFKNIQSLKITVHKKNPPLGGKVEESKFELNKTYKARCPKCGNANICYNSENCWCKDYNISPSTAENLRVNYEGCLCKSCFSEFGNKI